MTQQAFARRYKLNIKLSYVGVPERQSSPFFGQNWASNQGLARRVVYVIMSGFKRPDYGTFKMLGNII